MTNDCTLRHFLLGLRICKTRLLEACAAILPAFLFLASVLAIFVMMVVGAKDLAWLTTDDVRWEDLSNFNQASCIVFAALMLLQIVPPARMIVDKICKMGKQAEKHDFDQPHG